MTRARRFMLFASVLVLTTILRQSSAGAWGWNNIYCSDGWADGDSQYYCSSTQTDSQNYCNNVPQGDCYSLCTACEQSYDYYDYCTFWSSSGMGIDDPPHNIQCAGYEYEEHVYLQCMCQGCGEIGDPCGYNADCCTIYGYQCSQNGVCISPNECYGDWYGCADDADCCSGFCDIGWGYVCDNGHE